MLGSDLVCVAYVKRACVICVGADHVHIRFRFNFVCLGLGLIVHNPNLCACVMFICVYVILFVLFSPFGVPG